MKLGRPVRRWKDKAELCLTNRDWRSGLNSFGPEWDYVLYSYDQSNETSGFV